MAGAREFQLVHGGKAALLKYQFFDLSGKYIHSADDQHVIGTPVDAIEAPHRS
jgi:hypothetical protein